MATTLNWANWTYYMDIDPKDKTKFKTLEDFKAKYGTTVNYQEVIDDNDSFLGTIKPQLQAGQDTGWDIIVMTDWMAAPVKARPCGAFRAGLLESTTSADVIGWPLAQSTPGRRFNVYVFLSLERV